MKVKDIRGMLPRLTRRPADGAEAVPVVPRPAPPGRAPVPQAGDDAVLHPPEVEPGEADVRRRLTASGASRALTEHVVARVRASGARGAYAIDAAARAIEGAFLFAESPRRARGARLPSLIVFAGPSGSGKTTTLAKLGRRLVEAGRRVVFASLDPVGLSGLEGLETTGGVRADVDRYEVPLVAARGGDDLRRLVRGSRDAQVVLLDTPGLSARDEAGLADLARQTARIDGVATHETWLVLPACASRSSLELCLRSFAVLNPSGLVVTKLDETTEPAAALELGLRARLPLAFLCDGPDVRANVRRATGAACADLLLRGRLA